MTDTRGSSAIADRRTATHELGFGPTGPPGGGRAKSVRDTQPTRAMDGDAAGPPWAMSHLVRVPGAPARAWRPAPGEGPRSPLGGRRGGGTALVAASSARPGSPATGWIVAAASRSAAARIAAIWLAACCRTAAAARSAASCMALTSAHAHCVMLAAWPSARFRIRHACHSESVSRNRPGCCGYPLSCEERSSLAA